MTNKIQAFIDSVSEFLERRNDVQKAFREGANEPYLTHKRLFFNKFKDENPYVVDATFELLYNVWFSGEEHGFEK